MIGQLELSEPAQPITGRGRSNSRYQVDTKLKQQTVCSAFTLILESYTNANWAFKHSEQLHTQRLLFEFGVYLVSLLAATSACDWLS